MTKNHYIYLLYDVKNPTKFLSFETNKICRKIGSTCNMKSRMKSYLTGHPDKVPVECYYHIKNPELYTCYQIDNMIKIKYDNYRIKGNGGIEFYESNKVTQEVIEEYFNQNNIVWEKLFEVIDEDPDITSEDIDNLRYDVEQNIYYSKKKEIVIDKKIKTPRDYQVDIIRKSIEYYLLNDKGMLILICGVGKTLISLWITKELNLNKILIGVPNTELLKQWVEVIQGNNEYHGVITDIKILIVNSDCDKNTIIQFLKDNQKCIVITTYHSSYKVLESTNELNYEFDMKLNDECHHLTTSNMEIANTRRTFVQILNIKSKKQLSLTATIKQIETNEYNPEVISNENKEFFGDIIDRKNMIWAINKNIICDYVIQTIITEEVELEEILNKFEISEECDIRLFLSAYVTLKSITEEHSHHLLIYANKQENADKIIHYIKLLIDHEYFSSNNLFFGSYHSGLDNNTKENIINKFDLNNNGFMSCVYSLGEGWDFPKLDGVVFAETMSSNIRIVQSALRASRKNTNEPNKIAKMIIPILYNENWLDSNNDDFKKIKEIIYQLGLEDETIMTKVKVLKMGIDKKKIGHKLETNITGTIGEYQNELTEKLKLHTVSRQSLDITYEKARKIIKEKNIIFTCKDDYYKLCDTDIRLSRDPEKIFNTQFTSWFNYLGLYRNEYYDKKSCINKVNEYIIKHNIFDTELTKITKELQNIDNTFPPFDMWTDCYDVNDLSEIIKFDQDNDIVVF